MGVDTFDSSHPTRCARHGLLFTKKGNLKILNSSNRELFRPIEDDCECMVCKNYTVAYIHHLFKAKEITGMALATIHNLHFMIQLMADYRAKIMQGEL